MVRPLQYAQGRTVGFHLSGEPGRDDFDQIMMRLDLALAEHGQARLVLVLEDPYFRERFRWLWTGIDARERYADRIIRLAIAGAGPYRRADLAGPIPIEHVRTFGLGEVDEALLWAEAA